MKIKKIQFFIVSVLTLLFSSSMYDVSFAGINWPNKFQKSIGTVITNLSFDPWILIAIGAAACIVLQIFNAFSSCIFAKLRYQRNKTKAEKESKLMKEHFAQYITQYARMQKEDEYDRNVIPIETIKKAQFNMKEK